MSTLSSRRILFAAGILFLLLEVLKQWYLYQIVFGEWRVWYFPFQLCSMPIYLCLTYALCPAARIRAVLACFLQDFGLLGGVLALAVRSGFTFPDHPLLTAHGWLWHLGMIGLALFLWAAEIPEREWAEACAGNTGQPFPDFGNRSRTPSGGGTWQLFLRACVLFLGLAAAAMLINVLLHPFGNADMFYISPYRISEQPVFHGIDLLIGRGLGIIVYLVATMAGAALIHGILARIGQSLRD